MKYRESRKTSDPCPYLAMMLVCVACFVPTSAAEPGFVDAWLDSHPFVLAAASADPSLLDVHEYFGANFTCFIPYGSANQIYSVAAQGQSWMGTFHADWNDPGWNDPTAIPGAIAWIAQYESTAPGAPGPSGWGWGLADEVIGVNMPVQGRLVEAYKGNWPDKLTWVGSTGLNLPLDYIYGGFTPPGYTVDTYLDDIVHTVGPGAIASVGVNLRQDPDNVADHDIWFLNLMKVRQAVQANDMAFFTWVQAYQLLAQNVRFPSESDIRAEAYAAVTCGSKGILYGGYSGWHEQSIIDSGGDPTPLYDHVAELNTELARLGEVLKGLTSVDVRFVPGHNFPGPVLNPTPAELTNWVPGAGSDDRIRNIHIAGSETVNADIDKNALIGYFRDDADRLLFMVTNLHHGGSLSAGDAELRIHVEFSDSVDYLWSLSKSTGTWIPFALGADCALELDLPGGTGELFAFEAMDEGASGRIPDGGNAAPGDPLTLEKKGEGQLTLGWDLSCLAGDTDFGVYEGVLGSWDSHVPRQCTTQGLTTVTLLPGDGNRYYLVVPHNGTREGYYGAHSDGTARPPSSSACLPWSFGGCK